MRAKIFLDFNATHPPIREVLDEARTFYLEHFANSSGLSLESQAVNKRIEEAREEIAGFFGVVRKQILFTSCGTESNNLLLREFQRKAKKSPFCVTSSPFEHPSVANTLLSLANTEIFTLPANRDGTIASEAVNHSHNEADCLTALAVHNETGLILPINDLLEKTNGKIPVLIDCAQWLPKAAQNAPSELQPKFIRQITERGAFVSATGHKLGAGFGAGLIITPPTNSLKTEHPLFAGGNQEHGLRAGSHNTEAILALALALDYKLKTNNYALWKKTTADFEALLGTQLQSVKGFEIIASRSNRAPGTTLLLLPGVPIDFLVMALDKEGITVSTGTSCKSRSRSPSAALIAMGYSEQDALSVVRLSYAQTLGKAEMETVASTIQHAVEALLPRGA